MISFSKNKFTIFIIAFVFTALLMIHAITTNVYAETSYNVEVTSFPFNVSVYEGGSITFNNVLGTQQMEFVDYGWYNKKYVPVGQSLTIQLPITNCGNACFFADVHYTKDLNTGLHNGILNIVKAPPGTFNPEPSDTIAPVVTAPSGITIQTPYSSGISVRYPNAIATDNVVVTLGPTCTPMSDMFFPIGNTTITCTATDAAGNVGKATSWVNLVLTGGAAKAVSYNVEVTSFPFNVSVYEGGNIIFNNILGTQPMRFVDYGWYISTSVPAGESLTFNLPLTNCGITCFPVGKYHLREGTGLYNIINIVKAPVVPPVNATKISNFASEIPPIIGSASYLSGTNQQAHQFSGNTAKIYVTFSENVPTVGKLINIVAVFPNAQDNLPKSCPDRNKSQCLNIPYKLTYPGGVQEGKIEYINTTNLYDMVLSIGFPPVAGKYVFQTALISTSFVVYDPNTAEGRQAAQEAATLHDFNTHKLTMNIVDETDDKFSINESFKIKGNWINPTSNSVPIRVIFGSESSTIWSTTVKLDSNNNFETTLNMSDFAVKGVGYYWIRAEPLTNQIFDVEQIWLVEKKSDASIKITSNKNTIDRSIPNDFAKGIINYQNLNSVANTIIKTPDGIEYNYGQFSTDAFLTSGKSGSFNTDIYITPHVTQFDSFMLVVDDGATRGELEFKIIGKLITNSTSTNSTSTVTPIPKPVTVIDTIPPVITTDSSMTLYITNSTGLRVNYLQPRATDNVEVTVQPICSPSSFSLFPVGVTSVICTASDAAGNIGTKSFTITVINTNVVGDNIPPTFTKMQDISLVATTSNGATVTYDLPKVTDNIKVTSGPICTPASGSFFPIGQTIVTCTASDAAKNQGSTTFTVTVSSLIAVPVEIPSSVSVSTGKLYYSSTEAVFVTGIATPQTDNEVSITVRDSLDNLVLSEYLPVKISGVYTGIIFPNSLWNTNGTYLMSANYGTSTTDTAFEFEFVPTEINNSNIPTGITLSLDSTQRILGDKLEITSTLTGGASGQSILIDVTNPLGNSVLLQSLNTNEVGSVTLSVNIQDDWISGVYTITASDTSPLLDYSTSKSLQIVAPLPEIIISPTLSTTESGQTITSYDAGDIGYFSTSLLSESTSNVLVTVNVVDSEDTTLGVAFFKSVIGKGDSKIVLGFKIPEDAADGEAKIYVNTYTNWIDQGGIPISSELISTVNIKGIVVKVVEESIIDESYDAIISPANGSGTPGCEKNQEGCFIPNQTTVNLGDVVLFSNTDIVSHTFTAGSASDGPTGEFDSGLVISGDSYKWTANVAGEIDYFCMIHPWMTGLLIVQDNSVKPIILPENIIPTLSVVSNLVLSASNSTGTIVNYDTPTATGGEITTGVTCTPPSGSLFPIGSTQVTCTATNKVGNTGMTSFMVTINPVPKVSDQTLSVKVGKVSYNNLEPIFVTGSIGKITGQPIILEVYDEANNLISIKQVTPKESKTYTTVLTSNELWNSSGQYNIIATYGTVTAQNTFDFEVMGIQEVISEKIPKSLFVDTDKSTYVLGDDVLIEMQLVDGGSGQSILLEVRDSQNYPVLLQSLNTDNNGTANILYQSDSAHHSGIYSIITKSQTSDWEFTSTKTFVTVPQIPDITIGNTVSTLSDGNKVEYFGTGTMGYFHTPVVSKSVSDVLITVNIFDVQNTPLGLAYFDSKVVDDTFDIVLGLQIPQDAAPGLATVYINTYTEWPNEGGVPILAERVSFIEIKPSNQSNLILSNNSTSNNSTSTNSTSNNSTSTNSTEK